MVSHLGTLICKGSSKESRPQSGQHRHNQHPESAIAVLQNTSQHGKEKEVCQEVLEADVQERCISKVKTLQGKSQKLWSWLESN
jgi:hypothetical protein